MEDVPYSHMDLTPPEGGGTGSVILSETPAPNCPDALRHALDTMRLAVSLGVRPPSFAADPLPYSADADNLVFSAPLLSLLCGRRMFFLRGWKRYESCVKGFNALGLLAEHASLERKKLESLSPSALRAVQLEFLASRRPPREPGRTLFTEAALAALAPAELDKIGFLCLALWRAFARRTLFCSTSSNMGISLHQALRDLRAKELAVDGKRFALLNEDEGKLVIWCPHEDADFMNAEKAAMLRSLEAEKPALTTLRPYINRQHRDPGALMDALRSGGYFFPTNPQSRPELQNLIAIALHRIGLERKAAFAELILDPDIHRALESLGARIVDGHVVVHSAVEGGMVGMAVPALIMLEEALLRGDARAVCAWIPASIGAALAATVLCDATLRRGEELPEELAADMRVFFPRLADALREGALDPELQARIHGVFDIANLQSLAQLFGVPVRRHLSGRQTAYVGLGSSSYATGNLCFDILNDSAERAGAFRGRAHLHPATHSLNPIAQALVFAEELNRIARSPAFEALEFPEKVRRVRAHCRKPEPAGAAALAGYLLARLDAGTLSFIEIAYGLKSAGFNRTMFLEFCGLGKDPGAAERHIRRSGEEGPYMESLTRNVLDALGWELSELRKPARAERSRSRRQYRWTSIDDDAFEAANPAVHINLTGDYCAQPSEELVAELLRSYERSKSALKEELAKDDARLAENHGFPVIAAAKLVAVALSRLLGSAQKGVDLLLNDLIRPVIDHLSRR